MISLVIKASSAKQAINYAAARGITIQIKGNRIYNQQPQYDHYVALTAEDETVSTVREWFHETDDCKTPFPYGTLLFFVAPVEEIVYAPLRGRDVEVIP